MTTPHFEWLALFAVRVISKPIVTLAYHRTIEKLIHHSSHKVIAMQKVVHKCKWIPDAIMVLFIMAFDWIIESTEHSHEEK